MKKLSVIIVTFNSQDYIAECIDSIYRFNDIGESLEIIIVDNSNEEASNRMFLYLKDRYGDKVKCIKNSHNGGYGQGNNFGVKYATGEIICIMNPDVILTERVFGRIISYFSSDRNIGMIGLKQTGGADYSFYFRPEYHIPIATWLLTKLFNRLNIYLERYMYLAGALLFIRKSNFTSNEIFDENIFMYNEEADITRRFIDKKIKTIFDYKIKYIHNVGDRTRVSKIQFDYRMKSLLYYLKKYKLNPWKYLKRFEIEEKIRIVLYTIFNEEHKRQESLKIYNSVKIYLNNLS